MKFGLREMLFFLVLIGVPIASWWWVFKPQNREIELAKQEISHKEDLLRKLDEATAQAENLMQMNLALKQEIEIIESRLPTGKEVEVILQQVAEIAVNNNLQLPKVKTAKPVEAAAYMEQPLEMKIAGDFDAFYKFLLDLEKLDRITRMPDIEIKRAEKEDGRIETTFTLSIYFKPDDRRPAS